jgi:hypothetical protein
MVVRDALCADSLSNVILGQESCGRGSEIESAESILSKAEVSIP